MHVMHKLAVDMTSTQIKDKKGIKNNVEREVAAMYKELKKLEDMKVMGALEPNSLTISQKKVALQEIKPTK